MTQFKIVDVTRLTQNPFELIGHTWMAVCAGDEVKCNAMTASWGGLGVMWGKNVAYVVIRPQRFTKQFVDGNERFSLNFLGEDYRKTLNYLGSVSGHNEDKISKCGLSVLYDDGAPYFNEAFLTLFCCKLYAQPMEPRWFIDKTQDAKWYPQHDYHTMYVAEIDKALLKS